MANLNKVFLIGRLTRDPEQRFIPSGQAVVQFGLAVNRQYTTNGEKREETTFLDIEAWAQQGELIHRYLKKGAPIFIEGRLRFDSWETKEGEKRSKLRVVLERFQFLGQASSGSSARTGGDAQLDPVDFGIDPDNSPGESTSAGGESAVPF
ncbi:MAG: single-stranded DNA-binding protein [Planctomycetes bacterium]|nr:single-stranded DNA-binding protein [Planctomycetota bacterium]